jgi:3-hydroxyacyl-[acyl-carrier-protein] dehydratase
MMREIEALLPHRRPFLFVDEILEAGEALIRAEFRFTGEEEFFRGHFPAYPVVPGVLLVEAMAQAGGAGLRKAGLIPEGGLFFLATIEKARFRRQVRPGESLTSEIRTLRLSEKLIRQWGKASAGGEIAAEAEWLCVRGE